MTKQKYSTIGDYSHLNNKDMWFGSTIPAVTKFTSFNTYDLDKNILTPVVVEGTGIECLFKCYDELIVNAIDHVASCRQKGHTPVTKISVSVDISTNMFTIRNNGEGLTCENWPDKPWENLPVPYVLFTQLLQGSNAFKGKDCVKGGVNGVGTKGVVGHAETFTLRVFNADEMKYYTHTHEHCGQTLGKPSTISVSKRNSVSLGIKNNSESFTEVSFIPQLGTPKKNADIVSGFPQNTDMILVLNWLVRRMIYATAYVQEFTERFKLPSVQVTFNKWDLSHVTLRTIATAFSGEELFETLMKPTCETVEGCKLYPMRVIIGPKNIKCPDTIIANTNGTINSKGDHIDPIIRDIIEGVTKLLMGKIDDNFLNITPDFITNHIQIFINAIMPGAKFNSQSKIEAKISDAFVGCYKLSANDIKSVTEVIAGRIMSRVSKGAERKLTKNIRDFTSEKYRPCSGKQGTILLICEGDSAMKSIVEGVSLNNAVYPAKKFGFMTLSGGLMNARQSVALTYHNPETGNTERLMTKQFNRNVFINTLQNALGIRVGQTANRGSLKYSKIICCVDQDHDGKGKLFGLVVNALHFLWPELLDGTYLYKLDTPIRRAYKGNKLIKEFYSDREYDIWAETNNPKSFKIKYYKGLATHTKPEMKRMFANMFSHIRGYHADKGSNVWVNNYYDKDSTPRKVELSRPIDAADKFFDKTRDTPVVNVTDFLRSDVFAYNKDDIERKLYHAVDGQNNSGRKILNGIIKNMKHDREVKVAELGGSITESQNYHHGEACLERTIKGKAFIAVGGKQLPVLLPSGQFGSRMCGGAGAGSSRYIFAVHNRALTSLIFPEQDYYLLSFTEEDGKTYEPDYFVPIVPMSVLESESMPTHGWNFTIYGRDIFEVISLIKCMIYQEEYRPWIEPGMNRRGHTGQYDRGVGTEYTYGDYEVAEDLSEIVITELPYRVWTDKYTAKLEDRLAVYDIENLVTIETVITNDDETFELHIVTRPEFWDVVTMETRTDIPVEYDWPSKNNDKKKKKSTKKTEAKPASKKKKYTKKTELAGEAPEESDELTVKRPKFKINLEVLLKLVKSHKSNINMIGTKHEVIEFQDYIGPIRYWFAERKRIYIERVEREIILRTLRLSMDKDTLVYLRAGIKMSGLTREAMNMKLIDLNIRTYNRKIIVSPGRTKTCDLMKLCIGTEEVDEITFDYVLDIPDSKKTKQKIASLIKSINEQEIELNSYKLEASLGRFPGAAIWINELNRLEELLKKEYPRNWGCDAPIIE